MKDRPVSAFEPLIINDDKDVELLAKKLIELLKRIKSKREEVQARVILNPRIFFNGGAK